VKVLRNISAEFIKLKYPPTMWLFALVVICMTVMVFLATYLDNSTTVILGRNPWYRHISAALGMFSVLVGTPFIVMLVSTSVFVENQAKGWNYMYSSPQKRSTIFYSKLITILLVVLALMFCIILTNIAVAYLLNFLKPEIDYVNHSMNLGRLLPGYFHVFISMLGMIGIQYFLSLRFKGFLIPMSLGILAFVGGIIIGSINKPFALFYPYCYPNIVKDHDMFSIHKIGIEEGALFNTVEIYSIIVFVFFVGLAHFLEVRKQVS